MSRFIAPVLALLCLAACSPKPADAPEIASSVSPVGFGYDVALSFAPQAAARLKASKLKVTATYYGLPRPEAKALVDKYGVIAFGADTLEVTTADQTVHMTGQAIARDRLNQIIGPKPLVQITVTVPGHPDMLSCAPFQDYVAVAQEAPVHIYCKLS